MKYVIRILLTLLLGGCVLAADSPTVLAELATIQMRGDGYFLYSAITELISLAKVAFGISLLTLAVSIILSLRKRRSKNEKH